MAPSAGVVLGSDKTDCADERFNEYRLVESSPFGVDQGVQATVFWTSTFGPVCPEYTVPEEPAQ